MTAKAEAEAAAALRERHRGEPGDSTRAIPYRGRLTAAPVRGQGRRDSTRCVLRAETTTTGPIMLPKGVCYLLTYDDGSHCAALDSVRRFCDASPSRPPCPWRPRNHLRLRLRVAPTAARLAARAVGRCRLAQPHRRRELHRLRHSQAADAAGVSAVSGRIASGRARERRRGHVGARRGVAPSSSRQRELSCHCRPCTPPL